MEEERTGSASALWVRLGVGVVVLGALVLLGLTAGEHVRSFLEWVDGLGFWGPLVFVLGYAAAVVAFAPGSLLTLAAGAFFGLAEGTLYVFVAATLGASLAFLVSRYLARRAIEQRFADSERFAAIDRAVASQGRRIVFLLRLSPLIPFNALNYALGLTRVSFVDYLVASLGMLPGTFLYVYSGKAAGEVVVLAGGAEPRGAAYWTLFGFGLVTAAIATLLVTRAARRALREATHVPVD